MSDKLKLPSLWIKGFRCFGSLKIERLGRVNLIVGKNNSGKSSLLEALRLYASEAHPLVLLEILESRNEMAEPPEEVLLRKVDEPIRVPAVLHLFHGYPQAFGELAPIEVGPIEADRIPSLVIAATEQTAEHGHRRQNSLQSRGPALRIDFGGRERILPLEELVELLNRRRFYYDSEAVFRLPCVSLGRAGTDRFNKVARLWDRVALTEKESLVEEGLRILSPEIERVSFVGEEKLTGRIPVARTARSPKPVPLGNLGGGVNRVFELMLSTVNAEGGLLLVDEFEDDLHYSVQPQIWQKVFHLAENLNIQVFATTHSWDCVKAFQDAAASQQQEPVLIRLTRLDDDVVADIFEQREITIATQNEIEIR